MLLFDSRVPPCNLEKFQRECVAGAGAQSGAESNTETLRGTGSQTLVAATSLGCDATRSVSQRHRPSTDGCGCNPRVKFLLAISRHFPRGGFDEFCHASGIEQ